MKHDIAVQFMEVFSTPEILLLSNTLSNLPDTPNTGEFMAYANGFQKKDLIYPFIKKKVLERLEQLFDRPLNLVHGMILKEKTPWRIHTDYQKQDTNPDLAILIPLNDTLINTHTVIFNESDPEYTRDLSIIERNEFTVKHRVTPEKGKIVIFPGHYYHSSSFTKNSKFRCVLNINLGKIFL
jgi:hypothetical protein